MTTTTDPIQHTCPTWCVATDHDELAPLPERWHQSEPEFVDVMSEPPYRADDDRWHDSHLMLSLSHTFAHIAPTIDVVATNKDGTDRTIRLSVGEATVLADALARLVEVTRS